MAHISDETVKHYGELADAFLTGRNLTRADVKTGRDAWAVANGSGILKEAYRDRAIVDAHIQTALQKIFPNCVFLDKKVY